MLPSRSPYVLRHLEALLAVAALPPGGRVLELGCGMGRFTLLLHERGYEVTGLDLSPELLSRLRASDPEGRARLVCGDAAEADGHLEGGFDAVVGFFFLHHLPELGPTLRSAAALLKPGGRVAFCEPNAWNPSFYAQILLTPGMSFRGDGGVARMRGALLGRALRAAGFSVVVHRRYGLFPPALANHRIGRRLEGFLERRRVLGPVLAFQVLAGALDGRG